MNARYCVRCGARLEAKEIDQRQRLFCPRCGHVHYEQLKVGAGILIEREGCLLLLQRAHEPFLGCWNVPAGYSEADEHPAQTAVREAREETGLEVEVTRLEDIYFFDGDPRGNGLLILYRCRVIGGALSGSTEGVNPTYFPRDRIPEPLSGGGHDQAIRAWQKN